MQALRSLWGNLRVCLCCWLIWLSWALFLLFLYHHYKEQFWQYIFANFYDQFGVTDFVVDVPSDDLSVELCVRDYGCEDNDRVRVFVNSEQVFSGEIFHERQCVPVDIVSGENEVKMYAINGGGDYGCPNNVNTGELRIGKLNWQTQGWGLDPDEERTATLRIEPQ